MTVLEAILNQIDDKLYQLTELVISNRIDIEGYKFICGEIQGLRAVRNYVKEAKDKMEKYDDLDD